MLHQTDRNLIITSLSWQKLAPMYVLGPGSVWRLLLCMLYGLLAAGLPTLEYIYICQKAGTSEISMQAC